MATGTNTVTLFLRRRNNADAINIEEAVKKCFANQQDLTINGIEKPFAKYVSHVWDTVSFDDYKTLLQKSPNDNIQQHEIYQEYIKKIKAKNEQEFWNNILALEQNKLLYFILAYPQKLVLGKKQEKRMPKSVSLDMNLVMLEEEKAFTQYKEAKPLMNVPNCMMPGIGKILQKPVPTFIKSSTTSII